jgi:hypothetical protein
MATKKVGKKLPLILFDPGSESRDIRYPVWKIVRIRDKHPGSATPVTIMYRMSKTTEI